MTATTELTTTSTWVYVGLRTDKDGKRCYEWHDTRKLNDPLAAKLYKKQIVSAPFVGAVYTLTFGEDGRVFVSGDKGPRYSGTLDDHDEFIAEAMMQDAIVRTMFDAEAAKNKAKREHGGLGSLTLDQIAAQYRKTMNRPRGNALIAAVIGHIVSMRVIDGPE